jgi:hypothetical protein
MDTFQTQLCSSRLTNVPVMCSPVETIVQHLTCLTQSERKSKLKWLGPSRDISAASVLWE